MVHPMTQFKRILLIEFNELSPRLLAKWMASGDLPNFSKFYQSSESYITKPDVEDAENLEPWVQWYSLHTGLSYDQHGVADLTDGPKRNDMALYDTLLDAGRKVGCGGSMNVRGFAKEGSFFLADPWCNNQPAYPETLNLFQNFCAQNVQEYSNPNATSGRISNAQFGRFMLGNGLSVKTAAKVATQLAAEKLKDPKLTWRRPFILDRISWDVFRHQYQKNRPDFATFFSNSTAHLQHTYWRHMEPDIFTIKPDPEELELYGDAIFAGYRNMDDMLGEIVDMAGPQDLLIFATAISQQPFLRMEAQGGQNFYRPHDMAALAQKLGIENVVFEPVMTHQYVVRCHTKAEAEILCDRLLSARAGDRTVFDCRIEDDATVHLGCHLSQRLESDTVIAFEDGEEAFFDHFYRIDALKGGCHHPDGTLWIRSGKQIERGQCSILDIYPTILSLMGHADRITPDRKGAILQLAA